MKRFKFSQIVIFIGCSLFLVSTAFAGSLPSQWTQIDPASYSFEYNGLTPSCSCAPGTPNDKYTFFVKGGQRNDLVIYFQGGGAAWDVINAILFPTYTQYEQETLSMFSDNMEGYGIFDQTQKKNPFKGWGFVYLPYCTGDLFWGANDATYTDPYSGNSYTIKHRGFVDFMAALKYLEENTNYPGRIFVCGSSAGSYGATMAYPYIKEAFKNSNVYLLGDSGAGVLGGTFPTQGIYNWNVQMPDWIFPDGYDSSLTMPDIYNAIAAQYPWDSFGQYDTAFDATQIFFLNVMINLYNPLLWNDQSTLESLAPQWDYTMRYYAYTTAAASPNYRYYIGAGTVHTILMSPKFYTETSGGVSFVEWIDRMLYNNHKWENRECEVCLP